jgi:hypothetical protein
MAPVDRPAPPSSSAPGEQIRPVALRFEGV